MEQGQWHLPAEKTTFISDLELFWFNQFFSVALAAVSLDSYQGIKAVEWAGCINKFSLTLNYH
jgi:hypothetical protein